jgi:hypothetical protein
MLIIRRKGKIDNVHTRLDERGLQHVREQAEYGIERFEFGIRRW